MGQAVFVHPSNSMGSFRGICRTVCPRVNYRIAQTVVRSLFSHGGSPGRSKIDKLALDLLTLFSRSFARSLVLARSARHAIPHSSSRTFHSRGYFLIYVVVASSTRSFLHPRGRSLIHTIANSSTRAVFHPRKHFFIHAVVASPTVVASFTHPLSRFLIHAGSQFRCFRPSLLSRHFVHALSRPHSYRLSITLDTV